MKKKNTQRALLRALLSTLALSLMACACGDFGPPGGFGATPGGVQDMGFARELIEAGQVPPPEAFLVEGMFSEHDLPLAGEPCERTFCVRGATGVAPTLAEEPAAWLQLGLSSTINPETFVPDPLTLIATVDVSGSMGWSYDDNGSPGALTRQLLHLLIDELREEDRLAIVTYGTGAQVVQQPLSGDDKETLHAAVDALASDGSTNMEEGMRTAYSLGTGLARSDDERVRVMVLTDVQPNVGAIGGDEFEMLVRDAESVNGIETTVIAAGLGVGQEVLNAMSHLRGANAFSLMAPEDVPALIEDDWPWLAQPLAYDLELAAQMPAGYALGEGYGFPAAEAGPSSELNVSTVFLSKRRGALLVRLDPIEEQLGTFEAAVSLSYEDLDGSRVDDNVSFAYDGSALDDRGHYYEQTSVAKSVALAILVEGMRDAATLYADDGQATAIAHMELVVARISADVGALGEDESLSVEVQLAEDLLALMQQGADQGDLYGR
jgi:Ca-activated chloride channel family protein